jgi:hypothetical protein
MGSFLGLGSVLARRLRLVARRLSWGDAFGWLMIALVSASIVVAIFGLIEGLTRWLT